MNISEFSSLIQKKFLMYKGLKKYIHKQLCLISVKKEFISKSGADWWQWFTCMAMTLLGISSRCWRTWKCHDLILMRSSKVNSRISRPSVTTWIKESDLPHSQRSHAIQNIHSMQNCLNCSPYMYDKKLITFMF